MASSSNVTSLMNLSNVTESGAIEDNTDLWEIPTAAVVIPEVFAILCAIVGFLGNLLTAVTILATPKLKQNANNIFVCNLSVSDVLYCAFLLPIQAAIYHKRSWQWSDDFCKWIAMLKYSVFGAALLSLCAIALNRFINVVHPKYKVRLYTRSKLVAMLVLCWVVPAGLSVTGVWGVWGEYAFQPRALSCTFGPHETSNTDSHRIIIYAAGLFLPIFFMAFCYTRIIMVVCKSQSRIKHWSINNTSPNQNSVAADSPNHAGIQLTRSMLIIFVLFTVCVAPYSLLGIFDPHLNCSECHLLLPILSWIQLSINPIIYTVTNSQFQHAYKHLLKSVLCCYPKVGAKRPGTTYNSRSSPGQEEDTTGELQS